MRPTEPEMLAAWKGILFASARVIRGLEDDLLEQHDLSLSWFDVLGRLKEAPDGRLRMSELEQVSVFTRSGMTRLVDRIEAAGLVRRTRVAEDRRGVYVEITQAGREKSDAVWADHVTSIERRFGRYIDRAEAKTLSEVSTRIREDGSG